MASPGNAVWTCLRLPRRCRHTVQGWLRAGDAAMDRARLPSDRASQIQAERDGQFRAWCVREAPRRDASLHLPAGCPLTWCSCGRTRTFLAHVKIIEVMGALQGEHGGWQGALGVRGELQQRREQRELLLSELDIQRSRADAAARHAGEVAVRCAAMLGSRMARRWRRRCFYHWVRWHLSLAPAAACDETAAAAARARTSPHAATILGELGSHAILPRTRQAPEVGGPLRVGSAGGDAHMDVGSAFAVSVDRAEFLSVSGPGALPSANVLQGHRAVLE